MVDEVFPSDEQEKIFKEIVEIAQLKDETDREKRLQDFVGKRKADLADDTSTLDRLVPVNSNVTRFIGEETQLAPIGIVDGILFNDDEIYSRFLSSLIKVKAAHKKSYEEIRSLVPYALLDSIGGYFGNHWGSFSRERKEFFLDRTGAYSQGIPMAEMKGLGYAECMEKAGTAHNILKVLGYDTELVVAECELVEGKPKELHAYNLVSSRGKRILIDITNPVFILNKDGAIENALPYIHILTEDENKELLENGSIAISKSDYQREDDEELHKTEPQIRKYFRAQD